MVKNGKHSIIFDEDENKVLSVTGMDEDGDMHLTLEELNQENITTMWLDKKAAEELYEHLKTQLNK